MTLNTCKRHTPNRMQTHLRNTECKHTWTQTHTHDTHCQTSICSNCKTLAMQRCSSNTLYRWHELVTLSNLIKTQWITRRAHWKSVLLGKHAKFGGCKLSHWVRCKANQSVIRICLSFWAAQSVLTMNLAVMRLDTFKYLNHGPILQQRTHQRKSAQQ